MQWAIKKRLSVSATGYWGFTMFENATAEVATTGLAIRSHIEAGTYNDMTRKDISAIFANSSREITSHISSVAEAAESTSRGAADTQEEAQQLVETFAQLHRLVKQFKINADEKEPGKGWAATQAQSKAAPFDLNNYAAMEPPAK